MTSVIHQARPVGARWAASLALATGAAVIAASPASPAFAQYSGGGVAQDPTVFAQNFLAWLQPLLTVIVGGITIGCCVAAAGNPRAVGGIAGTGVFVVGLIWGVPYIPTAMGVLGRLTRA